MASSAPSRCFVARTNEGFLHVNSESQITPAVAVIIANFSSQSRPSEERGWCADDLEDLEVREVVREVVDFCCTLCVEGVGAEVEDG